MNVPIEVVIYLIGAAMIFGALMELMSTLVGAQGYRLSMRHVQSIFLVAILFWWLIAVAYQLRRFSAWRARENEEA